jgi:hypothetical protein
VGKITDYATDELIKQMKISGVNDLESLIKKALRELGAPVSHIVTFVVGWMSAV